MPHRLHLWGSDDSAPDASRLVSLVKSKFGAGRDFIVLDPATEEHRYFVDGKIRPRPSAEVRDGSNEVEYQIRGTAARNPQAHDDHRRGGEEVASLKAKMFSPIKTRMTIEVPSGEPWSLEGSFIEKNYSMTAAGRRPSSRSTRSGSPSATRTTSKSQTGSTLAWRLPSCDRSTGG